MSGGLRSCSGSSDRTRYETSSLLAPIQHINRPIHHPTEYTSYCGWKENECQYDGQERHVQESGIPERLYGPELAARPFVARTKMPSAKAIRCAPGMPGAGPDHQDVRITTVQAAGRLVASLLSGTLLRLTRSYILTRPRGKCSSNKGRHECQRYTERTWTGRRWNCAV